MAKSAEVCAMAIDSLLAGRESCRLWTFTVPFVQPPRVTAHMWSLLQRDLVRGLHFQAVRVFELHPRGHGLHVHAITPHFYPVDFVRAISREHGWGRIHVKLIPSCVAGYVTKYLSKQFWRPFKELAGMRLWACVGRDEDWNGVSCKNVVYDSPSTSFFRAIQYHVDRDLLSRPDVPFSARLPFRDIRKLGYASSLVSLGLAGIHMTRRRDGGWHIITVPVWDVPCLRVEVWT